MALMAVCWKCGANNSPMNTACDMCKAELGVALVETAPPTLQSATLSTWLSAGIVAVVYVLWRLFELNPIGILLAMFYGPLIASYRARENVVFRAALGGILAIAAVIVFELIG